MAPLDWDKLMRLNVDAMSDDPNQTDDMYHVLEEFDPGGENDAARLKKLFEVSQALMIVKGVQAQVAEDELAEGAKDEGQASAKKDTEIEELKMENELLNRELKDMKRFGAEGAGMSTGTRGDPTRFLRDELNQAESQILVLQKELDQRGRDLDREKEQSENYYRRAVDAEDAKRDLKRDNEQMRDDIRDYQRQLESQRETVMQKKDDDVDYGDKIKKKNMQLSSALDENRRLAEENIELEKKIEDMKKEMREGRHEIDKTTDDFLKLKHVVQNSDKVVENLRRKNEMLDGQVSDLLEQVRSKGDADDEIMVQVNNKVEEWKEVLAEKDDRILDLQEQAMKLRDQVIAANMDSEKASVSMLTKAVEERDRQITQLQSKLDEANENMNANAALIEDVRAEMNKTGHGPGERQRQRLLHMTDTIKANEDQLKDADGRAREAEEDARAKDKQLSEALERMRQYEAGEYGLSEAVAEIKEHKQQIAVRDRQIEELTQYINRCEMKINDLYDESEDLRERLGLDPKEPIDLTEYRKSKGLKMQEERALNRVLQKEVERLEEERIEMKLQIRKLAQATGQRAVALGLSADDMVEIDQFIDDLKDKKMVADSTQQIKTQAEKDELKIRNIQLDRDLESKDKKIERLGQENAEFRAKNTELETENKDFEKGLREISKAIEEQSVGGSGAELQTLQCPTLDRMLAAIDARNIAGKYDTTLYLKAQVDNLTGHNEELRHELRQSRFEATKAQVTVDKSNTKVENLLEEIKMLREVGAGGFFQAMPLPEGMAITSSDVIANLNEHLVQVLQELSLKEDMIMKMEVSLESYRRKFAVMRHQQGLLYQEYTQEKQQWEESRKHMEEELKAVSGEKEEHTVRIQEFDRLVDTLAQDDLEVRRRLADMTRKITVLRVNEKALTRRYNAMQEMEGSLRKDTNRLKNEMIAMETAVEERLGYLQRYKDMATFKIAALQKALDDSVPASDLELANKQFTELTEKYRDMLDKSNSLVARHEEEGGYEIEVKRLKHEHNSMLQELQLEKEKLHTLEAAFEQMRKQGLASSRDLTDSDLISISKKLTTLEMKELNERQRAEHAVRMYDNQKGQLRTLEDRNMELEQKFSELTRMHLDQQKVERELRDELANCVTKTVSDADRKTIMKLEQIEASLRDETHKLKEISEVATTQVRAFEQHQQSRDKELTSLRQQLLDFQAQSDEKTVIGKLHRHIVQLQVSEGTAVRKLDTALKCVIKKEAHLLRTEQKADDKDSTIYHNRLEARSKTKHLKHTIQDLRRKYAGSVPLPQQEKFAQSMVGLQEDKAKIEGELRKTNDQRLTVEDKLAEVELQHKGLQDLIVTLKDGRGAEKVAEWHSKMQVIQLEDLRYKREIERLKHQLKFQESIIRKHENEVLILEEEKIKINKEFEEREMEWEHREVELERIIANMERQQAAIAEAADQFESAVGSLPNSSWPVAQQLEHAITTIKNNVKLILDAKAETEHYKKRIQEMEKELRDKDHDCLSRDKVITELRLRLPASKERDEVILRATAAGLGKAPDEAEEYENRKAMKVAQSTVTSLQARINQKEETLQKYQELLKQARDDMLEMNHRHEAEMRLMQEKLHSKSDAAFIKFKQNVHDSLNKVQAPVPTNDQLRRLNEMEDIVADQDNSISALRDKLARGRQEIQDWKYKCEDIVRQQAEEKERLVEDQTSRLQQLKNHLNGLEQQLAEKEGELQVSQQEVERQQEVNTRAPTTTMKSLIERLRNQLALKEKQQAALSKALTELRADMVMQAQDDVKANADRTSTDNNVKKVVDRCTKEYQDRIEELESLSKKMKKELKKRRDGETSANTEMEETRHDLVKKETQVKKLREDKARMEAEMEELEKKVERMSTMAKQRGGTDGLTHEVEELRRKNRLLNDELKRNRHQAEKPYEQQAKEAKESSEQMVAKWEESKKWQKMVERLKGRVREKEQEIDKLMKNNESLKNILDRANKDKESLETKLRNAKMQALGEAPLVARAAAPGLGAAPATHSMQDLKQKNHLLEEEVTRLKRQLTMDRDAAFQEVQLRNKFLTERLEQIEHQMAHRMTASQEFGPGNEAMRELQNRERKMQKDVIKLSEENIELRFEVEQANKDIPRLKERIEDLQKYVEVLKAEKEQALFGESSKSMGSLPMSPTGNIRRIGESGKSTRELEKTVALLKKVIERTQGENEQLKRAPGVVSTDQLRALQLDNQGLKTQLEELRQKMGASLSERYLSQQKGTAKVMAEHDKLRKDLCKELETNEKLRVRLKQQEVTVEQLKRELAESKSRLEIEGAKRPTMSSMDSKGWKSVVVTRMYEEKMKAVEDDLDKKNKMLTDVKILLREAAEREHSLLHQKDQLQNKVDVLERFPAGAPASDMDLTRDYQCARLKIDRLENEKKELVHEVQVLQQRAGSDGAAVALDDDMLQKLMVHDKLRSENVDVMTELKASQLERDQLNQEVDRLKKELENFGPDFFEEIEDLKYNYREAVQKNVQYEEQLAMLSRQFGVDVPGIGTS